MSIDPRKLTPGPGRDGATPMRSFLGPLGAIGNTLPGASRGGRDGQTDPDQGVQIDQRSTVYGGPPVELTDANRAEIDSIDVGSWSPQEAGDPAWKATEVHMVMNVRVSPDQVSPIVMRFKSAGFLQAHIEALIRSYQSTFGMDPEFDPRTIRVAGVK